MQKFLQKNLNMLGFIAGFLTTFSFSFQVYDIYMAADKAKATAGISATMYAMFIIGIFLWLIYGIILKQKPIILWNLITLILASIVFYYIVAY